MAIIVGLTGGIGSGKTTIMKYIESLGYKVYYSDEAGRKILQQKEIINKIGKLFDSDVLSKDGSLDRKAIATIVFSDAQKLKQLNAIVHPLVAKDFCDFIEKLDKNEIVVKESAILFETNENEGCDYVILITAPQSVRIERVMKRDSISEEEVLKRIKNQMSEEEKEKKTNFIINNVDLALSFKGIKEILNNINSINC